MGQVYTFHKTVRGHLHVLNGIPCEDSSTSFSAEAGRYHIAVVADGHGSQSCFRSEYGAKAATEVAFECLQQFAEATLASEEVEKRFYKDIFFNPRYCQMTLRRLTDTIIAGWHDCVLEDYEKNPPKPGEIGECAAEYQNNNNILHIYGTTVIAALQLPECLVLLHQGDGRCDVFLDDGTVEQPIPWDSRCEDTATTSLCDADVADSFRTCIINLNEKSVVACYLGCDGVEDAYRDTYEGLGGSHRLMGGVHTFYKDLTCKIASMGREDFERYIERMLPEFSTNGRFSRSGSGDDVSIAGIVDVDRIQQFIETFQLDVKRYALEEDLFWREDELRGKTRKHGILQKRMKDAELALKKEKVDQQSREIKLQQLKGFRMDLSEKVKRKKDELVKYRKESQLALEHCASGSYVLLKPSIQKLCKEIFSVFSTEKDQYKILNEELSKYDEQIQVIEEMQSRGTNEIRNLEKSYEEAKAAFMEYDAKYQAIDMERKRIQEEIAALPQKIRIDRTFSLTTEQVNDKQM